MIIEAIAAVVNGKDLDKEMAAAVMDEIMSGEATQAQIGSFLTALHIKGETIEEITAFAEIMRKHCGEFTPDVDEEIDIVGTGGDCAGTFNISTVSSLVTAAGGGKVAKHGNRAASSKCGTADCLEALGVNIAADRKVSEACLKDLGTCFLFAQKYHTAMRFVGAPRKEIKIPTVFNILGPLANPSRAKNMVVGVYSPALTEKIAKAMGRLGVERGFVISGNDNMDEFTLSGTTTVSEIDGENVKNYEVTPEEFGLKRVSLEELRGGDGVQNAEITKAILSGKETGAKREIVLLNAGATLYIGGVAESIESGVKLAAETIDSGKAMKKLEELVRVSNS